MEIILSVACVIPEMGLKDKKANVLFLPAGLLQVFWLVEIFCIEKIEGQNVK